MSLYGINDSRTQTCHQYHIWEDLALPFCLFQNNRRKLWFLFTLMFNHIKKTSPFLCEILIHGNFQPSCAYFLILTIWICFSWKKLWPVCMRDPRLVKINQVVEEAAVVPQLSGGRPGAGVGVVPSPHLWGAAEWVCPSQALSLVSGGERRLWFVTWWVWRLQRMLQGGLGGMRHFPQLPGVLVTAGTAKHYGKW